MPGSAKVRSFLWGDVRVSEPAWDFSESFDLRRAGILAVSEATFVWAISLVAENEQRRGNCS
jgi:hypothetical protein